MQTICVHLQKEAPFLNTLMISVLGEESGKT